MKTLMPHPLPFSGLTEKISTGQPLKYLSLNGKTRGVVAREPGAEDSVGVAVEAVDREVAAAAAQGGAAAAAA